MHLDEGYRVTPLPLYPEADSFDLLAFPTRDPGCQSQRLFYGLPGFFRAGALLVPVGEATMGQGEALVEVDRLLKLEIRTAVLGQ